ncbi:hypothetical protein GCM10022294_18430 [Dietzia aurantiaca]
MATSDEPWAPAAPAPARMVPPASAAAEASVAILLLCAIASPPNGQTPRYETLTVNAWTRTVARRPLSRGQFSPA